MHILLVEDDDILGDGVSTALRQHAIDVDWVQRGEDGLTALATTAYSSIVLDIGLPGMSGLKVLEMLRFRGDATPVLMLTARDTVQDRVLGLNAGADDYLVKPFDIAELCARLNALSRRASGGLSRRIRLRGLDIDLAAHTCLCHGTPVELTRREFAVLGVLAENAGSVLSRERIQNRLYAWSEEVESNTIEVHIHHLRRKLGNDLIRTARGVGYVIDCDK